MAGLDSLTCPLDYIIGGSAFEVMNLIFWCALKIVHGTFLVGVSDWVRSPCLGLALQHWLAHVSTRAPPRMPHIAAAVPRHVLHANSHAAPGGSTVVWSPASPGHHRALASCRIYLSSCTTAIQSPCYAAMSLSRPPALCVAAVTV